MSVPPLKQNITPLPGKRQAQNFQSSVQPLGPQRSNSTLTPRVAPMAAVSPVIDDGKLKNRALSPDSPHNFLKRQNSCKSSSEQNYEIYYPAS